MTRKKKPTAARRPQVPARRQPLLEEDWVGRAVSRAFDKAMSTSFKYTRPLFGRMPSVDLVDKGDRLVLTADLPGVKKEGIKLRVDRDSVTISARSTESREATDGDYYYNERKYAGYYRVVPLPIRVDPKSARAHFEDNTLSIEMKKAPGYGSYIKID